MSVADVVESVEFFFLQKLMNIQHVIIEAHCDLPALFFCILKYVNK